MQKKWVSLLNKRESIPSTTEYMSSHAGLNPSCGVNGVTIGIAGFLLLINTNPEEVSAIGTAGCVRTHTAHTRPMAIYYLVENPKILIINSSVIICQWANGCSKDAKRGYSGKNTTGGLEEKKKVLSTGFVWKQRLGKDKYEQICKENSFLPTHLQIDVTTTSTSTVAAAVQQSIFERWQLKSSFSFERYGSPTSKTQPERYCQHSKIVPYRLLFSWNRKSEVAFFWSTTSLWIYDVLRRSGKSCQMKAKRADYIPAYGSFIEGRRANRRRQETH